MFDAIRKHTLIMGVILGVVSLSFVFFGIEGYGRFMEGTNKVAEVDGQAITQTEWDNAHREDIDRARSINPALDLNLLDSPAMKYASLERLVRDRVLAAAARNDHLMVSDGALAAMLEQDPNIAALRGADERGRGAWQLKDLTTGHQAEVTTEGLRDALGAAAAPR